MFIACVFFFKQRTAYELRISDWSSDVCSSDLPNGLITAATVGKTGTTGQTLTVIYDDLVDLEHSVDPAYREGGNCSFMMADGSVKTIKKIKDSQGRPIFIPGYDPANNGKRSEERSVGKEWVSTCRCRWSPDH